MPVGIGFGLIRRFCLGTPATAAAPLNAIIMCALKLLTSGETIVAVVADTTPAAAFPPAATAIPPPSPCADCQQSICSTIDGFASEALAQDVTPAVVATSCPVPTAARMRQSPTVVVPPGIDTDRSAVSSCDVGA